MRGRWCVISSEAFSNCVFGPFDTYEEALQWIDDRKIKAGKEIDFQITVLFTKEGD